MHQFRIIVVLFVIVTKSEAYSQSNIGKGHFYITGKVIGRDTGSVILWYFDKDNKGFADTVKLKAGKFNFSGTVNRACEALIWTNPNNRDFDDPSVIRFLLEPNSIHIVYNVSNPTKFIIAGSKSEIEKQDWDRHKSGLLAAKSKYAIRLDSLYKLSKNEGQLSHQDLIAHLQKQFDSVNKQIQTRDLRYVSKHPNSYLSAYLLSRHTRKLPVDSLEIYFGGLAPNVKRSRIGHDVLMYIYPLTDDNSFRKANPLVSPASDRKLSEIKVIYDISLRDTSGNLVNLSEFKGKCLLIDFWASWCSPCIENIPALNQLAQHYNPDSVQFISISLDNDLLKWKHSIIMHKFEGLQLSDSAGFTSIAALYCKVLWVPKYILIDRTGRIISYDAPQPIDPELKTMIDHAIHLL